MKQLIAIIIISIIIFMPPENKTEELEKRIEALEEKSGKLPFPLDETSEAIIENTVDKFFKDKVFDAVWRDYSYYSTFIESIDRYFQDTGAGGSIVLNRDGLQLSVSGNAVPPNYAQTVLEVDDSFADADTFSFNKETRFRTKIKIDDVTKIDFSIGGIGALQDGVGFSISDGVIKGFSTNNSVNTEVNVGTLANDTYVKLEYRYLPSDRVNFYVNDVLQGSVVSGLPRRSVGTDIVFDARVDANADIATSRTAFIMFYDLIQKK